MMPIGQFGVDGCLLDGGGVVWICPMILQHLRLRHKDSLTLVLKTTGENLTQMKMKLATIDAGGEKRGRMKWF